MKIKDTKKDMTEIRYKYKMNTLDLVISMARVDRYICYVPQQLVNY